MTTEASSSSTITSALPGFPRRRTTIRSTGAPPLEWFIDRYRVTRNKDSGIVNDPNGWFEDPRDLIAAIRRIVQVSVETAHIVAGLPEPFDESGDDDAGRQS